MFFFFSLIFFVWIIFFLLPILWLWLMPFFLLMNFFEWFLSFWRSWYNNKSFFIMISSFCLSKFLSILIYNNIYSIGFGLSHRSFFLNCNIDNLILSSFWWIFLTRWNICSGILILWYRWCIYVNLSSFLNYLGFNWWNHFFFNYISLFYLFNWNHNYNNWNWLNIWNCRNWSNFLFNSSSSRRKKNFYNSFSRLDYD